MSCNLVEATRAAQRILEGVIAWPGVPFARALGGSSGGTDGGFSST